LYTSNEAWHTSQIAERLFFVQQQIQAMVILTTTSLMIVGKLK
jgi:hypothetical protein